MPKRGGSLELTWGSYALGIIIVCIVLSYCLENTTALLPRWVLHSYAPKLLGDECPLGLGLRGMVVNEVTVTSVDFGHNILAGLTADAARRTPAGHYPLEVKLVVSISGATHATVINVLGNSL